MIAGIVIEIATLIGAITAFIAAIGSLSVVHLTKSHVLPVAEDAQEKVTDVQTKVNGKNA